MPDVDQDFPQVPPTALLRDLDDVHAVLGGLGRVAGPQHLKGAGKWALGIAEKIGVAVAAEALKRAM